MIRKRWNYRERITPWALAVAEGFSELRLANLVNEVFYPGVLGNKFPRASNALTWNMSIVPFCAYTRSGQRVYVDGSGLIDLWWQGDLAPAEFGDSFKNSADSEIAVKPLALPTSGKEVWVTLGIIPYFVGCLPWVDGHGQNVHLVEKIAYQFRVVHGEPLTAGTAHRPSRDDFKDGLILADIRILAGQTGISQDDIYYDRAERFALRAPISASPSLIPTQPIRFGHYQGDFPGELVVTPAGQYMDCLFFHSALAQKITLIQSLVKAPLTALPTADNTKIEISKSPDFDQADDIIVSLPKNQVYVKSEAQIEVDATTGQGLYVRCTQAGGHEWVKWDLTYTVFDE